MWWWCCSLVIGGAGVGSYRNEPSVAAAVPASNPSPTPLSASSPPQLDGNGAAAPASAPSPPPISSPDQVLSPTAHERSFRPSMPAHLAPELAAEAVIEEVFENQRLQPFRGWGHTWPGHFLPTDKANHWSRREHEGFPLFTGGDFGAIAPPLPEVRSAPACGRAAAAALAALPRLRLNRLACCCHDMTCAPLAPKPPPTHPPACCLQGWQWCEEKWHLDMSGQIIDACDDEGWSYGTLLPLLNQAPCCLLWLSASPDDQLQCCARCDVPSPEA